ncbi:hypothetical protein PYW07_010888 [Mythimna separata]|uniref:Uncharacterized protein n=1 Tax=Mythimna separata TaxID=271217 RepID=A0AAD8DKT2_MYTSE|nr:hypothetical protein PYW07_010888 [Mythimna separata]
MASYQMPYILNLMTSLLGLDLINNNGWIPIPPSSTTFQALRGYGDVERRMLPLILNRAVTVHKFQGTTLERAVIDLGKKIAKGQIYIALSRVKSLASIVLSDLDANKLLNKPHDDRSLQEMTKKKDYEICLPIMKVTHKYLSHNTPFFYEAKSSNKSSHPEWSGRDCQTCTDSHITVILTHSVPSIAL